MREDEQMAAATTETHNHRDRSIHPKGECPACDLIHHDLRPAERIESKEGKTLGEFNDPPWPNNETGETK